MVKMETQEGSMMGSIMRSMVENVMKDPKQLKEVIPKTADDLFDMLESMVPGMKKLQEPVVKTIKNFWPVAKDYPDVLEKMLPTLKDITRVEKPTEAQFAKWG